MDHPEILSFDAAAWLQRHGPSVTSWFATYLVHSTVLLGAVWLAARFVRSPRRREVLWRAALFGGFATAALQVGFGADPVFGRVDVLHGDGRSALRGATATADELATPRSDEAGAARFLASLSDAELQALLALGPLEGHPDATTREGSTALRPYAPRPSLDLRRAGPVALSLGLVFAAASLASGVWILARRRQRQVRLHDGALLAQLTALTETRRSLARVELWRCERARSPHATGLWRPRIVVPERALAELTPAEQRAMLAHELAHIERRDAVWLGITRAVQLLMPLQPLNGLARRRLGACAELLCDARAVERTGDRLALAQSLAKVASWILREDALPDAACAMASRRSLLGERVAHILDEEDSRPRSVVPARLGAAAALLGTVAAAPLVAPPGASVDGRAALPPAVEANTFSDADPTEAQAEAARETAGARTPSSSNPPLDTAVPRFPASAPTTTDSLAPNTAAPRSATAPGPTPPPAVVAATLAEVGASLDAALAELDGEVALLRETAARKVLSQALAARLDQLERRASELRARAKRIRDLLVAAHPGGMEVPRGGRERAASPSAAPRVR